MAKNRNTYKTFNIHEKTPDNLYEVLNNEFHFDFDPCPLESLMDGLSCKWGRRCFINPPYGKQIRIWLEKALHEIFTNNTSVTVFLLPASTDVKWFHEIVIPKASEIRFVKSRLKFGEHKQSAPFASMIVIFKK